jgi:hypothetical protein
MARAPKTDAELLELLLANPARKIAESMRVRLQYEWNNGGRPHDPHAPTEEERRADVLEGVREVLGRLMPEYEEKAREIYAFVPWPVKAQVAATEDFGPVPTFEKFMGQECKTCGGTGKTGFISGLRCPDC